MYSMAVGAAITYSRGFGGEYFPTIAGHAADGRSRAHSGAASPLHERRSALALGDVLLAIVRWGKKHVPGTRTLDAPGPPAKQRARPRPARARRL